MENLTPYARSPKLRAIMEGEIEGVFVGIILLEIAIEKVRGLLTVHCVIVEMADGIDRGN